MHKDVELKLIAGKLFAQDDGDLYQGDSMSCVDIKRLKRALDEAYSVGYSKCLNEKQNTDSVKLINDLLSKVLTDVRESETLYTVNMHAVLQGLQEAYQHGLSHNKEKEELPKEERRWINCLTESHFEHLGMKLFIYEADMNTTYDEIRKNHMRIHPTDTIENVRIINNDFDIYAVTTKLKNEE